MKIDISQFHQTFFEESLEGLDTMEHELLRLEVGNVDIEAVNTIFRVAHSIKGGSATFDFKNIADFTHVLETLLDEMREGKRVVNQQDVELLLKSVDCLRNMFNALQNDQPGDNQEAIELIEALGGSSLVADDELSANASVAAEAQRTRWQINFRPEPQILATGNDPILMFRELKRLGDITVSSNLNQVPDFADLHPEDCFISWQIELVSDATKETIKEVFEWVEDECELEITAEQPIPSTTAEAPSSVTNITTVKSADSATSEPSPTPPADSDKSATSGQSSSSAYSIRVGIDKVDNLINLVGELVITQSMLSELGNDFDMSRIERLQEGLAQLEQNTRGLQESVMLIRMLPISFIFNRFPRMIRDLAQKLNKKVELRTVGEQTELDKTVMEKIGDPMVHLVRNAMDHGIESAEERIAKGKPEQGVIELNAYHQGGNIVIEISDDGAGLNKDKILAKAKKMDLLSSSADLTDDEVNDLIFHPGFSTAQEVSDISGRGVGMDVVRRNIQSLGGSIDVHSKPENGSVFRIRLPLTLSILDGQLIRVGNQTYIVPLVSVIESLQMKKELINQVAGEMELYQLRDDFLPIIRIYQEFGITPDNQDLANALLVVVEGEGRKVGLLVDDLLAQQQVVIKSLDTNYKRIEGISGATILGDGTVALIIDIVGIINRVSGQSFRVSSHAA